MTKSALIIGGTGQIGWATAENLLTHGWNVTVASRTEGEAPAGARSIPLDREDHDHVRLEADGMDLVVDTVAYTPAHGEQLATLAGTVGSLVVISTASVYTDEQQRYFDVMEGPEDFPAYPVPVTEEQPTIDNSEQTYSPLKAAMERVLLATPGLPVSILRPGAIHGPHSPFPREWFFVKRALDGREHAVLAYDGESVFGTTATANIAELARLCGERPGVRALNAGDIDPPNVRTIGETVFRIMGHDAHLVGMPGPPRDSLGTSPWAVPAPFVMSMDLAREQLGYRPVVTYEQSIQASIEWMLRHLGDGDWRTAFPKLVERYGADEWFDYDAEDAYVEQHTGTRGTSDGPR